MGLTVMDNYREVQFKGHIQLQFKYLDLIFYMGIMAVEIKPYLSPGHNLF